MERFSRPPKEDELMIKGFNKLLKYYEISSIYQFLHRNFQIVHKIRLIHFTELLDTQGIFSKKYNFSLAKTAQRNKLVF